MRKPQLTKRQRLTLRHLKRNGGRARLGELPQLVGANTIQIMAQHGLLTVSIVLTGKGMAEAERMT